MSQRSDLARPFAPHLINSKPGSYAASYVSHDAVTQKLLAVVGPFDFDILREIYDGGLLTGVVARMTLTIDGESHEVTEVGDVENPESKKTNGARLKDASSDAIKRCAMRFGVGLHLWADSYFLYDVLNKTETSVSDPEGDDPAGVEDGGSVSAADPLLSGVGPDGSIPGFA